ncbi:hypothetical protein PSYMO_38383, partial [Pseudomonas amygdali pv. mori str. 301020]
GKLLPDAKGKLLPDAKGKLLPDALEAGLMVQGT